MATDFCLLVKPLSGDRLELHPFDLRIYADKYVTETSPHPNIFTYLPYGPFNSTEDFCDWYRANIEADASRIWFAIIVTMPNEPDQQNTFAGIVGLLNTQPSNAATELGYLTIFPNFQRTFVFTHAAGLLLSYLLDTPPTGLGLRRVQWQAHADNVRSINAAKRLGFAFEGIARWQRVLPRGKTGLNAGDGRMPGSQGNGRHSAILSMCWDDWLHGKKDHVQHLMDR